MHIRIWFAKLKKTLYNLRVKQKVLDSGLGGIFRVAARWSIK